MAILAIDWGTRHVGLAISYAGVYAKTLTTLRNNRSLLDNLKELTKEHEVSELVVGLPKNEDGSEATVAKHARRFANQLKKKLGLPLVFEDEHLTSKEAVRLLQGKVAPSEPAIDAASAKLILEQYLSNRNHKINK